MGAKKNPTLRLVDSLRVGLTSKHKIIMLMKRFVIKAPGKPDVVFESYAQARANCGDKYVIIDALTGKVMASKLY